LLLCGLVPNHAGMVRKRLPPRNREPRTIPVIQSLVAFSSKVDTGSRQENGVKTKD
jgi:hypothetical protein